MLRCGVVPAGIPWITTSYAFDAKPGAFDDAMSCHCITCVMRTTGSKPASWRAKRADQVLVTMYQPDHYSAHLLSTRLNSVSKPLLDAPSAQACLTITTISRWQALMRCCRNTSLITRLTWLRSVACGSVRLLATMPSRALLLSLRAKKTLKCLSARFSACRTRSNPSLRSSRCAAVNPADSLDSESCTALGATCIDHGTAAASLHAHQKAVGAFSSSNGRLICAFHVFSSVNRKTRYYKSLWPKCQVKFALLPVDKFPVAM